MFAGALKYSEGAVIVGETSYGKGVGQYHISLEDGSVVVLTNFEILLPGGVQYNATGIAPDVAVENVVVAFPEYGTLSPLGSDAISAQSSGVSVRGLEQRLQVLGLFDGAPDNTFDDSTLAAVNEFQESFGLAATTEASVATLEVLDSLFTQFSGLDVLFDHQLDAAVNELLASAHMPLGCTGAAEYLD